MTLYVDGILVATAVPSATWSTGCSTFTLGRFTDGGTATRYFNGKVADVQVWPGAALTAAQVATSSAWSPWFSEIGVPSPGIAAGSAPAVSSWASGRLDVFVRGTDNAIWHAWYDSGWNAWQSLGGALTSSPAAVSWAANRIDLFGTGTDGNLWHQYLS